VGPDILPLILVHLTAQVERNVELGVATAEISDKFKQFGTDGADLETIVTMDSEWQASLPTTNPSSPIPLLSSSIHPSLFQLVKL